MLSRSKRRLLSLLLMSISPIITAQEKPVDSVHIIFDGSTPSTLWRSIQLNQNIPTTRYRIQHWDGVLAIEAKADQSMSLFARPLDIDLKKTPILCWRWRIDAPLIHADMKTKEGDDYAARIYIAFTLPPELMSMGTRLKLKFARSMYGDFVPDAALNYVWDNLHPIGTEQANAYTDRTRMIVVQTGKDKAGRWINERRDVLSDAIAAFGSDNIRTSLFAVATDTDNTGEQAHAGFAEIHFLPREQACLFSPKSEQ